MSQRRRRRGSWTLMMLGAAVVGEAAGFGAAALTSDADAERWQHTALHVAAMLGVVVGCIVAVAVLIVGLRLLGGIVWEDVTKGLPRDRVVPSGKPGQK